MIEDILHSLRAMGLLDEDAASPPRYYWHNRASMNLLVYPSRRSPEFLAIKLCVQREVSRDPALRTLFASLAEWFRPDYLGSFEVQEFYASVFRGYDIETFGDFRKPTLRKLDRVMGGVVDGLVGLHVSQACGAATLDGSTTIAEAFPEFSDSFEVLGIPSIRARTRDHLDLVFSELTPLNIELAFQHGDAVVSNIGLVRGSTVRPMLVDWATYGQSLFPLLDILTFSRSVVSNFGSDMYSMDRVAICVRDHVTSYCERIGIDRCIVRAVYPVCVAVYGALRVRENGYMSKGAYKAADDASEFLARHEDFILNY